MRKYYALHNEIGELHNELDGQLIPVFTNKRVAGLVAKPLGLNVRPFSDPLRIVFPSEPHLRLPYGNCCFQSFLATLLDGDALKVESQYMPRLFATEGLKSPEFLDQLKWRSIPFTLIDGEWPSSITTISHKTGVEGCVSPMTLYGRLYGDPLREFIPLIGKEKWNGIYLIHPGWTSGVETREAARLYIARLFDSLEVFERQKNIRIALCVDQLWHLTPANAALPQAFLDVIDKKPSVNRTVDVPGQ